MRRLFSYTEWANERILETVRGLSEEQFTRTIESSYPTIRDTMAHIVLAEWLWLRRWKGESPRQMPAWLHEPSLAAIEAKLREVEAERRAFFDTLTDADLATEVSYHSMNGDPFTRPYQDMFAHVANHSTYHRGQLVTMLRQVGAKPQSTDMTVFLNRQ